MKLVYKYFNYTTSENLPYCEDDVNLSNSLNDFRRWYLKKKFINGSKIYNKNTPKKVQKILTAFDRKIKNLPLFVNEDVRNGYFIGIELIYREHYKHKSIAQQKSSYHKMIAKSAEEYLRLKPFGV